MAALHAKATSGCRASSMCGRATPKEQGRLDRRSTVVRVRLRGVAARIRHPGVTLVTSQASIAESVSGTYRLKRPACFDKFWRSIGCFASL